MTWTAACPTTASISRPQSCIVFWIDKSFDQTQPHSPIIIEVSVDPKVLIYPYPLTVPERLQDRVWSSHFFCMYSTPAVREDFLEFGGLFTVRHTQSAFGSCENPLTMAEFKLDGSIPLITVENCLPLLLDEPLGVLLSIAPWNAALILGQRPFSGAH